MKSFLLTIGLVVAVQAQQEFFYTNQFAAPRHINVPVPSLAVRTLIAPHEPVAISAPAITYSVDVAQGGSTKSKEIAHEVFQLLDLNGNGQVTVSEMNTAFHSVGVAEITEEHIQVVYPSYDKNQDNELNIFEFMPMYEDFTDNNRNRRLFSPGFERLAFQISMQKNTMANHQSFQRHTDSESVHLAFQLLDLNGDGQLEVNEMKVGFNSVDYELTEEDIQAEMPQVDLNNDNQINIFEFMQKKNDGAFSGALTSFISSQENTQFRGEHRNTEAMHHTFQLVDMDHNGLVTVHEMKIVSASIGLDVTEEELLAMMPYFDVDNMLTIVEWLAMNAENDDVRANSFFSGFLARLNSYIPSNSTRAVSAVSPGPAPRP